MLTNMHWLRRQSISGGLAVSLIIAMLGWSFASSFIWLIQHWSSDSNTVYCQSIIPISLYIVWNRRRLLAHASLIPSWWGVFVLLVLLALRVFLYEWNEQYIEAATIPL